MINHNDPVDTKQMIENIIVQNGLSQTLLWLSEIASENEEKFTNTWAIARIAQDWSRVSQVLKSLSMTWKSKE